MLKRLLPSAGILPNITLRPSNPFLAFRNPRFHSANNCSHHHEDESSFLDPKELVDNRIWTEKMKNLERNELHGGGSVIWNKGHPSDSKSFCRQCIATGNWSVFAPTTTKGKPYLHLRSDWNKKKSGDREEISAECPFCPGNEYLCPPPVLEKSKMDYYSLWDVTEGRSTQVKSQWEMKVVPNKYSFLMSDAKDVECAFWGNHPQVTAAGIQEVLVCTPKHNTTLALESVETISNILTLLATRARQVSTDPRVRYLVLFENHGVRSGGSIEHSHFQIVGLPIIPLTVLQRLKIAQTYHESYSLAPSDSHTEVESKKKGKCIYCDIIQDELKDLENDGSRIVYENEGFIAFIPYAPYRSFQVWLFPKEHHNYFDSILEYSPTQKAQLSKAIKAVMKALYNALGDPDYNIIVRQDLPKHPTIDSTENIEAWIKGMDIQKTHEESYHWYLDIIPHITSWGGISCFDLVVHKLLPEQMAEILRDNMEKE